jgi:plastocyanin
MRKFVAFFGGFWLASAAAAASLAVQVRAANGAPVTDAVVTVTSARAPPGPIRFGWAYVMRQENITFAPHVLIVPVGANVTFPNMDKVRHHVYSFSKPKTFELKLYGREQARSVVFDKPGVVAIGCNIHDQMSGYVVAVDTPYAATTEAGGRAMLANIPDGAAMLTIWSPSIRAPGNAIRQAVTIAAGGPARIVTLP